MSARAFNEAGGALTTCGALALYAVGCATLGTPRIEVRETRLPVALVVVGPVVLRYEGEPYEAERRTEDVLSVLWTRSQWPVIGPTELVVLDPESNDPLRATDILNRASSLGVLPANVALLKTIVSLREARGTAVVSGKGALVAGTSYEGQVVVSVSLVRAGGSLIGEIEWPRPIDPFQESPEADPLPDVREALISAVSEFVDRCGTCVRAGPELELSVYPTASALLRGHRFQFGPSPSAEAIEKMDEIERDAIVLRTMQYFLPDISTSESSRLEQSPPGFCIRDPAPPPFQPDDCVISVGTVEAPSAHTLRRSGAGAILSIVSRDGTRRVVEYR